MTSQPVTANQDTWRFWALRLLIALALLAAVQVLPVWEPWRRLEFDLLASLTAPVRPDVGVLVVGLDEPSLAELGLAPPLPRRLHAQLAEAVAAAGAAALGVDMLFAAAQTPEDDAAFGRALQGTMPVVLASAEVLVQSAQVAHYRQGVVPLFADARLGRVDMQVDDDGVLRRAPDLPDALWRVLAMSAGRAVTPPPPGALLRFYAPEVALPYVHYSQALQPQRLLPAAALQGKLLLLGQNTPVSGADQFMTPLHALGGAPQSGVFLHATALINGLASDWVVPAHPAGPLLQAGLSVGLVALLTRRWRGWRASWLSMALTLLALGVTLAAYLIGVWWSALPTLAGLALHLNVGAASSYWREWQRREQLRHDFASYVPPAVVAELAAAGVRPAASAERRVLTLLFSDLAGFTSASEAMPPESVAEVLNAYFTRMTATVHGHGGTLDKFIGDAVMAFWNAPLLQPDHAAQALACALAMQADMDILRTQWQGTAFARVRLRIGLHTGEAAVGHLGSQQRFTYTAVGDAVNTAARLEGANKPFGTEVLVSGATRNALLPSQPSPGLLWLDAVVLSGRSSGIDVFTPCDDAPLVGISLALQDHAHAGRWPQALECCADWGRRSASHAPLLLGQAERLSARMAALANTVKTGDDVSTDMFGARKLDKS